MKILFYITLVVHVLNLLYIIKETVRRAREKYDFNTIEEHYPLTFSWSMWGTVSLIFVLTAIISFRSETWQNSATTGYVAFYVFSSFTFVFTFYRVRIDKRTQVIQVYHWGYRKIAIKDVVRVKYGFFLISVYGQNRLLFFFDRRVLAGDLMFYIELTSRCLVERK